MAHAVTVSRTQPFEAAFQGPVDCRLDDGVFPGLTLVGTAADSPGEKLILSIMGPTPRDLPHTLLAPRVVALDERRYRITSPPHEWTVSVHAVYAHRDVGGSFYAAIAPRAVPWKKRLFLGLMLRLAGSRAGRCALQALRRS